MNAQTIMISLTLVLALLGWAYQLGRSDARLGRNEKDISDLQRQRDQYSKEMRSEIKDSFDKVYRKLDDLPCHNPGGWKKENCS